MNLAYISSSAIPSKAANAVHVMKMCQALARAGHAVTLFYPNKKYDVEKDDGDIFAYYGVAPCFTAQKLLWPALPGKAYVYAMAAAWRAKKNKSDFVFGRNLAGCFAAAWLGLPVMFESHAPVGDSGPRANFLFRRLIARRSFRKLVVITHALKNDYIARYPQLTDKIIVAADGADPVSADTQPVILPHQGNRLQVGYVGSLYSGRGIEVIAHLAKNLPMLNFHIVGGQKKDIAISKTFFTDLANITFHGHQPPNRVNGFLLAFDVLLAPYQETVAVFGGKGDTAQWMSPLKIFEYMSAGKAMIASDLPALREVLMHETNALLASPKDLQAWQRQMEYLRDNSATRFSLGQRAKEIFLEKYTWQSRAEFLLGQFDA